ncbi:MAG: hypothetical protein ACRYG7_11115 [Janthinobacterium lividum]|jgi:hypothetical protein
MLLKAIAKGFSILFILFLLFSFSQGLVDEISLLKRASYTVAHPTQVYRSAKWEKKVNYWYTVEGKRYERTTVWYGPVVPGQRCLVRYAVFSPSGNDLLQDVLVPDSIQDDGGKQWQAFIASHHLYLSSKNL